MPEFINKVRAMVYNNFGAWDNSENLDKSEIDEMIDSVKEEDKEEFEKILSYNESSLIILSLLKTQKHKITKEKRYILDENIFISIIQSLNDRMVSNILNELVNKGLVESSYDEDKNDFIFWIKEIDNEQRETN
jgi:hypothetical protein